MVLLISNPNNKVPDATSQLRPARRRYFFEKVFLSSIGVTAGLVAGLFFYELGSAQRQHQINRSYQPVPATIVESYVTNYLDSDGDRQYEPKIQYRYEVAGKTWQSEQLTPISSPGDEQWAQAMTNRYRTGAECTVYHDPRDPGQAVLCKRYSFEPYYHMLQGAFSLTALSFIALRFWFRRERQPVPAGDGWFEVPGTFGARQRWLMAKLCTQAWYGFGAVAAAHFFLCVPPPYADWPMMCFGAFALLGLVPLGLLIRYWLMNRTLDEARLRLDRAAAVPGQPIRFSISQSARQQVQLKQARVRLLCIGIKRQGNSHVRRTVFETTAVELKDHILHVGESLELSGELVLPPDQRPTGRYTSGEFDWIIWEIRLDGQVVQAPDYTASFPLVVKAPPVAEPAPPAREKTGAMAEIRPIDPAFAGRILTKGNILVIYLIGMLPLLVMLLGTGLIAAVFPLIFPDQADYRSFLDLPRPQAIRLFAGGGILLVAASIWGILCPNILSGCWFRSVATRAIRRRPDAIVLPGADSLLVDMIPRSNWNRMMLENAADVGFLAVDAQRREIRFEGDRERYRVPADALQSCELVKSLLTSTARPNAPGTWLVVLRASGESGIWEAPLAPRLVNENRVIRGKVGQKAAQELQAKIKALLPA
jgi:hypothetical protein